MQFNEQTFKSPPATYRPAPFWSWNDTLTDQELRWQVSQLQQAGYGGFFMHSRVGLETEYLSREWFDMIGECIDEARKRDMEAWLYDEDKWPSGFAGGWMTRRHPDSRGVACIAEAVAPDEAETCLTRGETLAVFAVRKDKEEKVTHFRRISETQPVERDESLIAFRTDPFTNDNWWNGQAYIDMLDPKAVRQFLDMTLDGYVARFRKDFGHAVPGIFTDEPNYHPYVKHESALTWTPRLPHAFRERFGYDLINHLPALIHRTPGFQKIRHDYYRMLTELFINAFSRPYGEICGQLGLKLTGHWLSEDSLRMQTTHIGAAMPHYEYEQVPGIDHLCRNINDALTLKQVASAARQFGRNQVMCEIFGVSGQDFTFERAKWIGDFHLALGVNYFCPHLTLYSFAGDRKRDYPPTFSYHQPYWQRMSAINDYFARLGYMMRSGQRLAKILVLHPIASAWSFFEKPTSNEVEAFNDQLIALQTTLLQQHRDFDYGDEIILSRHGRVENGHFLVASHGTYDVVIVPPSFTWSDTTATLLESFVEAGGRLIFTGDRPVAVDGEPAPARWARLIERSGVQCLPNDPGAIADSLEDIPRDVSIVDEAGREIGDVIYQHRRDGDRHLYFFANTNLQQTTAASIMLAEKGTPLLCDPATGEQTPLPFTTDKGRTRVDHTFPPAGSLAVLLEPAIRNIEPAPAFEVLCIDAIEGPWSFERTHPNTLVLDVCRWSLNDGPLGEPTPVWKARRAAFDAAGLEAFRGIQPWVLAEQNIRPTRTAKLAMHFTFVSDLDQVAASLVIERPEHFTIELNGKPVTGHTEEWHWDNRFGRIDVANLIHKGDNRLILTCQYRPGVEIEDVFVVGDFATRPLGEERYALTAEPPQLENGDWGPQGYHFYSGNMIYQKRMRVNRIVGERRVLQLIRPAGTLFDVRVNGHVAGTLAWQPWELDLTDRLVDGDNDLDIIVYGSLRNTFGPLHNPASEQTGGNWWVGPESFTDEANWTNRYLLVPYGLLGGARLTSRGHESEC